MNKPQYICSALLASLLCFSCTNDEGLTTTDSDGLWLNPQIAGKSVTRAVAVGDKVDGVESLNENKLNSLDVFIGKNGNFSTFNKRFSTSLTTTEGTLQIAGSNWQSTFNNAPYDVYIVANSSDGTMPDATKLDALKAKTQTDADIYKPHADGDEKSFLMDGVYKNWTPSANESDIITVELNRAAAKIEVSIEFDKAMKEKYTAGAAQWKFRNYSTSASVLAEAQSLTAGTGNSGDTPLSATTANDGKIGIITYSYPCKWSNADDMPYLLVNIPLTPRGSGEAKTQNWYHIPVRDINATADDGKQLDRNHIYYVNATIASEGSSTEQIEKQDVELNYVAIDWMTENININESKTQYLLVSPTTVYMRNLSEDNSITYFASSDIEIVNKEVYYYDENGNKQDYTDADLVTLTPTPTADGSTNGTIMVDSPIPDEVHAGSGTASNLSAGKFTVRFIRFRVQLKNDTTKYQDILVKQYPLEYIQNVAGWYSTRSTDGWIDWAEDQKGHYPQKTSYSKKTDNYSAFLAKVSSSNGTQVHYYRDVYDSYNYYYKAEILERTSGINVDNGSNSMNLEGLTNNFMYVIQITSTSDSYIISHPKLDNNYQSEEHVASPAFMLASQLGGTTPFRSGKEAAAHCHTYREVDRYGKKYDNWRLPTKEEIEVIMKYQITGSGAPIATVLSGDQYWALDGNLITTKTFQISSATTGPVRCVRDLTPEEVEELDANKQ